MIALAVSDQCADAYNSVVDVLRKLIAEGRTDVRIRVADKIIGGGEAFDVGDRFDVPNDDAGTHENY